MRLHMLCSRITIVCGEQRKTPDTPMLTRRWNSSCLSCLASSLCSVHIYQS